MEQMRQSGGKSKGSCLMRKEQRKQEVKRLAEITKSNITESLLEYKQVIEHKGEKLMQDVQAAVLSLLETMQNDNIMSESEGFNITIDDKMVFSLIQKQLFDFINHSESGERCSNRDEIQKLELRLEQSIIKEHKLQQQLSELKRKYRNKHPNTPVAPLPLPSITVLATRHQRENRMLMEQNSLLSNRLIQIQSETTRFKSMQKILDTTEGLSSPNPEQLDNERLKKEIVELRQLLESSNERLLQTESRMYETKRLLEMESQRTECETDRVSELSTLIRDYERSISRLGERVNELQKREEELVRQNMELEREQKELVRKEILNGVMTQLREESEMNRLLKEEVEKMKGKLRSKDDDLRNKEIYYIQKIDEYSLMSKKNYDQLVQSHLADIQTKQSHFKETILDLKNKLSINSEQLRYKQESTLQLTSQLQETRSNLKQIKKTTRKSIAKKNESQRQLNQQTHLAEIQSYSEEIAKFKLEYKLIRETYTEKMVLLETKNRLIKERFNIEILAKLERSKEKNSKVQMAQLAQNLVESFNNVVHKQSLINRLTKQLNDLKAKKEKDKPLPKERPQQEVLTLLNSQICQERAKVEKSICEQKVSISEQKLLKSQVIIKELEQKVGELVLKQSGAMSKIRQLERTIKEKKAETVEPSNDKVNSQEIEQWKGKYNQMRKQRDNLQLQVKIKKDALNHMKSTVKVDETQTTSLKKSNDELKEQIQKLKKCIKQHQRKEQAYKQMKQKLDSARSFQKENMELRQTLEEKSRVFKQQLSKKEFIIKLQKEKERESEEKLRDLSMIQNESNDVRGLEESLQKEKMEVQRKDSVIKVYKEKIEKLEERLSKEQSLFQERSSQSRAEIIKENKRVEQLKLDAKKYESELFSLKGIMKKIYNSIKEVAETSQHGKSKSRKKTAKDIPNLDMFSQGLSILNLNVEEVHDLLPGSKEEDMEESTPDFKSIISKITELTPLIREAIEQ